MWERILCSCRTELVWDGERRATGLTPEGASVVVGRTEGWEPEQLLASAADSSLMMAFLARAERAGIEILGYVSSARVTHDDRDPEGVRLTLAPCVVVADAEGIAPVRRLLADALAHSPVGRSLHTVPRLEPEVVAASLVAPA